jgi:membrane peptidoglycan carboxypeptidase
MEQQGMISSEELSETEKVPLEFASKPPPEDPDYRQVKETVRREVERELGPQALKKGGEIYTTLDPALRKAALDSTEE